MPHVVPAVLAVLLSAGRASAPTPPDSLPAIVANTNEAPAGRLVAGVLTIHLVARRGFWSPEEQDGLGFAVEAFGEEGGPLRNPGPMIRVREGTVVRASIRNALSGETLVVHGLHTRPGAASDAVQVAPGATRIVRFTAGAPGTYFYWATTTGAAAPGDRHGRDSQLAGVLVVDPRRERRGQADHVFVISVFDDTLEVPGKRDEVEVVAINGRSYPHTENPTFSVADSVRWRWINASDREHPMHLHGFFFRVDARGDAERDSTYTPEQRRLAVTESMLSGTTMRIAFSPDRPGNWIFHCHITYHIVPDLHLPRFAGDTASAGMMRMAGLVIAFRVRPRPGETTLPPRDTQRVRLLVQSRPRVYGGDPGYGYVVQTDGPAPASDSIAIPGQTIVLTRGRPARITVVNRLPEATAVHWHGMELESYYDGITGMSGTDGHVAPEIVPGDSFVAEMTPPRAGTFIYHTHSNDVRQLSLGLYGALLVLEPGQTWDPATDHVVFISLGALGDSAHYLVNGSMTPAPLEFRSGVTQRLRFISMPTAGVGVWTLRRDSTTERWTPIGKDGAELPLWQQASGPARLTISVGETYDVRYTPAAPGPLRLELQLNGKARRRVLPVSVR